MAATSGGATSDAAVQQATGRAWDEWFSWLHDHDAEALDHSAIVDLLDHDAELASGWWCQQVTVRFEQHIGRRVRGQAADGTFQVEVRRTFRSTPTRTWELLASDAGATAWLGASPDAWWHGSHGGPAAGDVLEATGGERYEVRSFAEGTRIRLRTLGPLQPVSTIQLTVAADRGRTVVGLHQEGLPDELQRDQMREHWKRAMDRIASLLDAE